MKHQIFDARPQFFRMHDIFNLISKDHFFHLANCQHHMLKKIATTNRYILFSLKICMRDTGHPKHKYFQFHNFCHGFSLITNIIMKSEGVEKLRKTENRKSLGKVGVEMVISTPKTLSPTTLLLDPHPPLR
jgi:hypothetical protein